MRANTAYEESLDDGRVRCLVCPRECSLSEGAHGLCHVRENRDGHIFLNAWGRSSGFCLDPIEKKPLHHFLPGSAVLSFGTSGCNLFCRFCQNWDISKVKSDEKLLVNAPPEKIAQVAKSSPALSVAFTYNDPVIYTEYAVETAAACRAAGLKTVAVSAGYVQGRAREDFFGEMDAANIDLKSFSEDFYRRLCAASLAPVLDTLRYPHRETSVHLEITTLVIPGSNDSEGEIRRECDWILTELGDSVPVHFSAFHPDFRMRDIPATPAATLVAARRWAMEAGLKYVYTGNIHDPEGDATWCPGCGKRLIARDWYEILEYGISGTDTLRGECKHCGKEIPGLFPASAGNWGRKRQIVNIHG